ncbi:MAG: hypothetical protein A2284_01945 [Deltaproteobacteria bacterium RIFOXYA12_FULL_61_11]|nr:MAG: hypothetical protein A2284_01945 [Deltaproteobacteria bacterium RIFOXYA12_FULL_61_11]
MPRVVVIGIDGASPELLAEYADLGVMPNYARLKAEGCSGVLTSTIHPNTPQAWTTLFTGVDASRHGIFDFRRFDLSQRTFHYSHSGHRLAPMVWELPGVRELRSLVVNLPLTYPATSINGLMLTGMNTPSMEELTWPPEAYRDVLALEPDYRIDTLWRTYRNAEEHCLAALRMAEARARLLERLFSRESYDLSIGVFTATDRMQHLYWHRRHDPRDIVARIHGVIDAFLGRLAEQLGRTGDLLLLVSDHGFTDLEADFYPNNLLRSLNLLKFQGDPHSIHASAQVRRGFEFLDWDRTPVYAYGFFGSLYLNHLMLTPKSRNNLRDDLIGLLREGYLDTGLSAIWAKEDLFEDPASTVVPEVLLIPRHYRAMARDGSEFLSPALYDSPSLPYTGTHAPEGLYLAWGKGVPPSTTALDAQDVAPLVLRALSVAKPSLLHGCDRKGGFDETVLPCRGSYPTEATQYFSKEHRTAELDHIGESLRGLGYL